MTARSMFQSELAQLEAETFEIQDVPELDQAMGGSTSTSSCTSTTSCACSCTSTCSTTSTVTCSCTLAGSTS
jgi:thiazolylpeptide-type bacteriocin precursor